MHSLGGWNPSYSFTGWKPVPQGALRKSPGQACPRLWGSFIATLPNQTPHRYSFTSNSASMTSSSFFFAPAAAVSWS